MAIKTLSVKTIDAHVESAPAATAKSKKNLCEIYKGARPVIIQACGILKLIKPTWGKVLEGLVESLDDACPIVAK